ncbi:hypothetical protein K2X33_05685 [bacterium]|nr:hypothetical protein [bacterium]
MSLIGIINIIMQILAFIAGLFNPKTGVRYTAFVTDFDCGAVEWQAPPVVSGGEFSGTAQVRCRFEGQGGGGIQALRKHLVQQLRDDAQLRSEPKIENYGEMPSLAYEVSVDMGEGAVAHGKTHIATDGFTVLKDVFESQSFSGSSNAAYLKNVVAEYQVESTEESGVFELRASQQIRVRKPGLMSSSAFKSSLMEQAEEALMNRATGAVQEMASHL